MGKNVVTNYPLTGVPLGSYTSGNFTYSSTIDAIDNLYAKWCYDTGFTKGLPIRVLMHGWSQQASDISQAGMETVAQLSRCFVLVVGMRGRDSADGSMDISAREIYDIYDAIQYVITHFSSLVNPENIIISGYSGGGGNTLAFCCKFPDLPVLAVDYCGISDYAYGVNSWKEDGFPVSLVQGSDSAYARYAPYAIANYECLSYLLYIYHGADDVTVLPHHSTMINDAFTGETYSLKAGVGHISGFAYESDYKNRAINIRKNSIGNTGSFKIIGYIKTSLFEIWLGNGMQEVADLSYNVTTDQYTITPQTGSMEVTITQYDGKTKIETISEETIITVV
ncbi:MAG TPA: prolyl oligopeptidase family serine peptidase [Bacteroidales bacterium]|nr:prolyl oligopeptidase family serine peptidase [Bacteroidales bacterium]